MYFFFIFFLLWGMCKILKVGLWFNIEIFEYKFIFFNKFDYLIFCVFLWNYNWIIYFECMNIYIFLIWFDFFRNIKILLRIFRYVFREMSLIVIILILIVNSVYNGIMFMKRGIDIFVFILFIVDSSIRYGSGKFLIFFILLIYIILSKYILI